MAGDELGESKKGLVEKVGRLVPFDGGGHRRFHSDVKARRPRGHLQQQAHHYQYGRSGMAAAEAAHAFGAFGDVEGTMGATAEGVSDVIYIYICTHTHHTYIHTYMHLCV